MSENQEAQEVPAKKDFVPSEGSTANKKTRVGIVKSTGMEKTIVVEYTNRVPHPKFKKIINLSLSLISHLTNLFSPRFKVNKSTQHQ